MSQKKRRPWRCLHCGMTLHRTAALRLEQQARQQGGTLPVYQVCGGCKTVHLRQGEGLRLLSVAETFAMHLHFPEILRFIVELPEDFGRAVAGDCR